MLCAGRLVTFGKCDLYRPRGYYLLYGKAGFYNFDEYIRRTAVVCPGIICRKASLCDYGCGLLQGTSGRERGGLLWIRRILCSANVS